MLRRVALVVLMAFGTACARPYPGPKTLAAVGSALLVTGGTAWAVGEGTDRRALVSTGFVTSVVGALAVIGAGGWLALSINCRADPDCPDGEQCKEVPAPPGGIPYRQCVRRS